MKRIAAYVERKRKVLFFAEGITMTHFVRPAALAESLDPVQYDIHFRAPSRYHGLLRHEFASIGDLRTIDPAAFLKSLAHGQPLYTAKALHDYVLDDLEIINDVQPDMVVGDFRLSLCISARLAGVPYASVFNAHWSPYYRQPAIVPEIPLTRWVSPRMLNPLFALLRPSIYASHSGHVNRVRLAHGLPAVSKNLCDIYTAADLVLYPDVPELVPLENLPPNHHFIGNCYSSLPVAKPAWWTKVMSSPAPKIFVALGSSGQLRTLPAILQAADTLGVDVILSTSNRATEFRGPRIHVSNLLPYEETAAHCAVVVSHGGTGALYPTLAAGTPMLAIPSNIDQHLSTALLERSGTGIGVRVEDASPHRLHSALQTMLHEPSYKLNAETLQTAIKRHDARYFFPRVLDQWFGANVPQAAEMVELTA